jgi:hypothetical protein
VAPGGLVAVVGPCPALGPFGLGSAVAQVHGVTGAGGTGQGGAAVECARLEGNDRARRSGGGDLVVVEVRGIGGDEPVGARCGAGRRAGSEPVRDDRDVAGVPGGNQVRRAEVVGYVDQVTNISSCR